MGSSGLGQFPSLLSPFMNSMGQARIRCRRGVNVNECRRARGAGLGRAAAEVEATAGRAGSLGGLSVPATWTSGGAGVGVREYRAGGRTRGRLGRGSLGGGRAGHHGRLGDVGGTPMAAGMHGRGTDSDGTPRYGKPVKVLRRR